MSESPPEAGERHAGAGAGRAQVGRVLAPAVLLGLWLVPLPLSPVQHRLAAIAAAVVVMWVTEVLPVAVTALLIAPAMVAAGITDAKTAFAPYADPLLFLFYGSFFIAMSMQRHGLDRRLAYAVVSSRLVHGVPKRTRLAMMVTGSLLSMWISNTASTAILVPILIGTLSGDSVAQLDETGKQRAMTGGLLAIAYACSIGGMGTLVGTPPNMITVRMLRDAGIELAFLDWVSVGVPASLLLVVITYVLFDRTYPPHAAAAEADHGTHARTDGSSESSAATVAHRTDLGPLSRGEWVTAAAFVAAVIGWVTPGVFKAAELEGAATLSKALPAGAVAMLASSLLFLFKDRDGTQAVLPWREAKGIDWGIIMLFGGGISLGSQMFETGLARALGRGFIALTGVTELWTLTAIAIGFTIFFTEVCSNTATANMLVPLVIGVTSELGISPVPPCLGVALAASCAFMMPIATGPNAIVYGSGRIELSDMMREGFKLNVLTGTAVWLLLRVMCPWLGWA